MLDECHWMNDPSSSSSACPELERSGFHEVLPVFSILGVFPTRVETKIMRLEICSQGTRASGRALPLYGQTSD